jgi:hypothetical protein
MNNGGAANGGAAEDEVGGTRRPSRPAWLRRHWVLASAVALTLVAGGVAVPLALGPAEDSCKELPAGLRELAKGPARSATRALDPGDDMSRFDAVRALLPTGDLCGDGGRMLGQVVDAATGADASGKAHTTAQARVVYAVTAAYRAAEVPGGVEPGLARMLAGYVVDTTLLALDDPDANTPAVPASLAAPDEAGWSRFGPFLSPGDAHPDFAFDHSGALDTELSPLFGQVAKDPQAFAILYDAERAYLGHYLERLTRLGTDPDHHPEREPGEQRTPATLGIDHDLADIASRIGGLLHARASARVGDFDDLASFDAAVRRHTRGAYRAAPRQLAGRPPMGSIAGRPVSGPVQGDLMDGRHQMTLTVDAWAAARKVPAGRASAIRQVVAGAHLQAVRYGSI